MNTSSNKKTSKAIALIASLMLVFGLMPLPALAANAPTDGGTAEEKPAVALKTANNDDQSAASLQANTLQANSEGVQIVSHNPYTHAKDSHITQEWGPNTVLIHCEWEYQPPISFGEKNVCQFHEWPLIVMSRPDAYYDGTPKQPYFNWMTMNDYPFGKQYEGFPFDFAEWDGVFTYTGINGTVEYGPTDKAPIGEGTYYVYATLRIPSAATLVSDGTFILGKTFTIEPSAYNLTFDANPPNSASTTATGAMPEIHFNSRVDTRQLPPNQFLLPGYKFDSWNTKEDGSGQRYENNALVKDLSYGGKDVTLYAQWKPKTYEITYLPGDATGDNMMEEAVFDTPGKLKAVDEMGWTYDDRSFLGWSTDTFSLMLADQEDFINLNDGFDSNWDPRNAELTAQWVKNGQIIATVTKDGAPQGDLERGFSLKSTTTGTVFTMPTKYEDGRYTFDPSKAATHGGTPAALPPDEYDLCFEIAPIPGSPGYPATSKRITYKGTSAVSAVFDYYTVGMVKDPAFPDACKIEMAPVSGAGMAAIPNAYSANALDGATLELSTTAAPGYHFDGYTATGVAPLWEESDPMKVNQTIEVQGQAEIMAHVAANTYTVRFDANTNAPVIGSMENQDMVYDEPQNLFANEFVRSGAVFTGWNTKTNGTGTAYKDGESVKNLTTQDEGALTLYAQWKETPVATALLTFNLAGGTLDDKTGEITVSTNVGDVVQIPAAPTREGYTFKCWSDSESGKSGSKYNPGDKYTVEGDHAFTAVWEQAKPDTPVKISIAKAKVTLAKKSCVYDGKAKKPKVKSVVLNGKKLKAGTDYAVKYSNNKKIGTATVTVTGKGGYKGSAKAKFKIKLAKAKLSTIAVKPAGTSATASWKKVAGAKNYRLQYRPAGGKWKTATAKGVSRTVKGLKAGKLYQFRARAVAGKQAGAWSDMACRYLGSVKSVRATVKKAGSVTATWQADPKANAGYAVLVRYAKGGAVAAQASVPKGKGKATVKGLDKGERYWVEVRPMRASGGKTYAGMLNGAWAKTKSSKSSSVKSQSARGKDLAAAGI